MSYRSPLQEFLNRVAKHPDKIYLNQPENQIWRSLTWAEVDNQARRIASGLLAQGFQPGDRIAIFSKNCAEWLIADFAIVMAGMISVPIYATAGVNVIEHVLAHSDAKAIFIGKLDSHDAAEKAISKDILRISLPYPTLDCQTDWNSWLQGYEPLEDLADALPDQIMTLVYTSGSTGLPKGVALTFKNVAASSATAVALNSVTEQDRFMSYLPLGHVVERCLVEWPTVFSGSEIYFVESLDTFVDDVHRGQPTIFLSVPRLWTKFQSKILAKMPDKKLQRLLKIPIVKTIVAKKIREGLGLNHSRSFGSGSAPIAPSILEWYSKLGINISEGWGMTETSGLSCSAFPFALENIGSIGKPVSCVEMKLSDEGEILIRGDAVFNEYYLNPEATTESFSGDWFHTGDLAECSDSGVYKIIGRVKEQFKTSKGKYVSPAPIENLLGRNTNIEQVCVLGSGRKQPIAMVVLTEEITSRSEDVRQSLITTLSEINKQLESHQFIDHIIVCDKTWSIENELLTPTLKIRRNKLETLYKSYLEAELKEPVMWESELVFEGI